MAIRARQSSRTLDPVLGFTLPGLALAAILTWVVLMFGPGSTVVHQGSYATVLLLFVSLSAWLATLPGLWPYAILTLQAALFAWGWVLTSPANDFGPVNVFMTPVTIGLLALLFLVAARTAMPERLLTNSSAPKSPKA
jgi:hypothetical protein